MVKATSLLVPATLESNNFDALRLLMALLVVWSHCFAIGLGSEDSEPISVAMHGTYNAGNIGVRVFFMISGFLICHSYRRSKSHADFFVRRVRRIYPGYLAAMLLAVLLIVPLYSSRSLMDYSPSEVAKVVGLNLLLRNYAPPSDVFGGRPLNGSLWSIAFEFWCYIGLALLGLCRLLSRRALCAVLLLALMFARAWLDFTGRKPGGGFVEELIGWPYVWFQVLPCFMAGVAAYLYRDVLPRSLYLLVLSILALVAAANLPIDPLARRLLTDFLFVPVVAYVVFYVAFSRRLRWHGAARWGDFSYGTYLYAFPIQQMLVVSVALPFAIYVGASMVLSLAAGVVSWYCVERWFLASRQKPTASRPVRSKFAP